MLTVALLQMVSQGVNQEVNLKKGELFCRRAAGMGADIALFPEMWNIGYTIPDPRKQDTVEQEKWHTKAIDMDDPFGRHFRALAKELNMAIAITYLERWSRAPRNSVSLIDRFGEVVFTYGKVHTCDFDKEILLSPGDGFRVSPVKTVNDTVQIGCMICFDREFPESARLLMLQGAEIILTPNACTLETHRLAQFRTRAYENMVGVAMTNYAAPQNNGHSCAFDPIAFNRDESSRDTVVIMGGEQEDIFLASFDMEAIREYRAHEVWGNAYRKPRLYNLFSEARTEIPFVRPDARR